MSVDRPTFTRGAFFTVLAAAVASPKKTIGYKRDLPTFQARDVLTHTHMNEIVARVNER